jgi:predicted ATPase
MLRVESKNVAGLVDGVIDLPDAQVTALAGANGTGKSKLLACLLIPWTKNVPAPRDPKIDVEVMVTVEFTNDEQAVLDEYAQESGWTDDTPMSRRVVYVGRRRPLGGTDVTTEMHQNTLRSFPTTVGVLKRQPSLDLVFLPAERRLLPPNVAGVDLTQLSEDVAISKLAESRNAVQNFGRLDDAEFESYATALCVQGALKSEDPSKTNAGSSRWDSFKVACDELLFPKTLLPLTVEHSSNLRVGLPGGGSHPVHDLSSGERQALIIVSRVFRAGEQQSFVVIDEPDAYLHPTLSTRLLKALRPGLGDEGRMLVATHSPAILDAISPSGIVRLSHVKPPQLVENESDRIDLYREAGFRASTLTQSDVLILAEGDFDAAVIPQLLPSVTTNSMQSAGGRHAVISSVKSLSGYELPIVGVVDADVRAPEVSGEVRSRIHIWPAADIEGVLLQDEDFLTKALEGKLLKAATCPTLEATREVLRSLLASQHDNAVAEYAQRVLREKTMVPWPNSRGENPLGRLREVADKGCTALDSELIDAAVAEAEAAWTQQQPEPWNMVRGKYIIGEFVSNHTVVGNKDDFISAVLARNPKVTAVETLGTLIASLSPAPDGHAQQGVDSPGTELRKVISGVVHTTLQPLR